MTGKITKIAEHYADAEKSAGVGSMVGKGVAKSVGKKVGGKGLWSMVKNLGGKALGLGGNAMYAASLFGGGGEGEGGSNGMSTKQMSMQSANNVTGQHANLDASRPASGPKPLPKPMKPMARPARRTSAKPMMRR